MKQERFFWPPSSEGTIKNFFQAVKSFMEKNHSLMCVSND